MFIILDKVYILREESFGFLLWLKHFLNSLETIFINIFEYLLQNSNRYIIMYVELNLIFYFHGTKNNSSS